MKGSYTVISRIFRTLILMTMVFMWTAGPYPVPARAQEGSAIYDDAARKERARAEQKEQRRVFRIDKYLEKARKLRWEKNFRGARNAANAALKLDKDNEEAQAFLEYLDIEEKEYEEYKKLREKKKEEERLAKKEARRKERERRKAEKLARKKAGEEERYKEKVARKKEKAEEFPEPVRPGVKKEAQVKPEAKEEFKPEAEEEAPKPVKPEAKAEEAPEPEEVAAPEEEETLPSVPAEAEKEELPLDTGRIEDLAEDQKIKAPSALGEELPKMKPGQPIIVDGEKVEYFEEDGRIVADGNVSITYGDIKLSCDRIEVNSKTRVALCEGNVRIEQKDGTLTGDRIRYDFNNKRGEIIGGEVDAFPWFGQAEETARVGENEYLLRNGFITTCDLDSPHYRIKAQEIRVFPDEKIIAKNVVFYIGKVPVLWFPYYYHPIIQSRAKVQFIPGWNSDWGYFLLSAWRFYIKGNTKVDLLLDYRTEKGFAQGADLYYSFSDFGMPGLGEGIFRSYFIEQNDWGTYKPKAYRDEGTDPELRKRFQWKHRIDFRPGTVGMLEFNKMSDEYVLKDYFYNEYEEADPIPNNYVSVVSNHQNYIFSIEANKRFHDFYTVTQRLPEVKLEIPDQRLWDTPFYLSSDMSATYFDKKYAFDSEPTEMVGRVDMFKKLSYVTHLGPVNLTPYGTLRETLYQRKRTEHKGVGRTAFGGGINIFSRFHRIYDLETDALGMDINGLRHIIVPSIDYYYLHKPNIDPTEIYQMDEIDALDKNNGVRLSLENKLQTKRHDASGNLYAADLVRFIAGVDYVFRMKKDRFDIQEEHFSDLNFDLELRPYDWCFVQAELDIEPSNESVSAGSIEATLHPVDVFQMALGYRYEKKTPEPRNQFTFDTRYRINPKWAVGWYERFDLQGGTIEEQQISILRDLHCWEVEFVYDVDGSNFIEDDFTFWLAFKIKAFPDLPIGLSRSFEKRPPGSLNR